MIVLDASVLIAFLDPSDALHADAVTALIARGGQRLRLSPITHAEILVGPTRAGTLERTRAALAALGLSELALPLDAATSLARLRVDTKLQLPDCCVILAAQQSTGSILTFDDRLSAAARRLSVDVQLRAGRASEPGE